MLSIMKVVSRLYLLCMCVGFAFLFFFQEQGSLQEKELVQIKKSWIHAVAEKQENHVTNITLSGANKVISEAWMTEKIANDLAILLATKKKSVEESMYSSWVEDNEVVVLYKELTSWVKDNILWKVSVDDVLPNEWIERNIRFQVIDGDTKEPIPDVNISLRGGYVWVTDSEWYIEHTRALPQSHSLLYVQAQKLWYAPSFAKKELFNGDARRVNIFLSMKKVDTKIVKTTTEDFSIDTDDVMLQISDNCALHDKNSECYEWEVIVEYNYIAPWEIDGTTIPMKALVNWEIKPLISNGMMFTQFYDNTWATLKILDTPAEVCYNLSPQDVEAWQAREKTWPSMDGYRWFDISDGLWKFDEDAIVSISENQFCVTTRYVY